MSYARYYDGGEVTVKIEYSAGNAIYIGEARPGSLSSSTKWRIKKLTYSGADVTDVQWAGGSDAFIYIWDNRASYTYS